MVCVILLFFAAWLARLDVPRNGRAARASWSVMAGPKSPVGTGAADKKEE
jgi:hypothetical protein